MPNTKSFRFDGNVIKLTTKDYERWRSAYPYIDDFEATLQTIDDYYTDNPIADGKWFFRVSRWLGKENREGLERQRTYKFGIGWW